MSTNAKKAPRYVVEIFPNSGHQMCCIPLEKLIADGPDVLDRLVRMNRHAAWRPWSEYVPWILMRYDFDAEGKPCIRLAIETNLGETNRGILFDVDENLVAERPDDDEAISPYASPDEAQIELDYRDRSIKFHNLPNREGRQVDIALEIHWTKRGGFDAVDVDLIVDLGNTRTASLLLETPDPGQARHPFGRRVQVLRVIPRGEPFTPGVSSSGQLDDDCAIIDSWLLLHRPQFHNLEPPQSRAKFTERYTAVTGADPRNVEGYRREEYLSHTFVELSPALIGGGRTSPEGAFRVFAGLRLDREAKIYLSSPKRYAWDDRPTGHHGGTFWMQIPNSWDEEVPGHFARLGGLIRYFMDPSGQDREVPDPEDLASFRGMPFPDAEPSYPRRDAICWFALSLLECAYRQINSPEYLRIAGRPTLPRRLRNVRVTYPAGWTTEERTKFFDQWKRALSLFGMTRFSDPSTIDDAGFGTGSTPVLAGPPVDEAVCSQLPVLYSDLRDLNWDFEGWVKMYGSDLTGEPSVRVMNVDIGGGTTDLAIIEYRTLLEDATNRPIGIRSRLLFRNGHSIAGDMLVKKVVEMALIPAWLAASGLQNPQDPVSQAVRRWTLRFLSKPDHQEFASVDPQAAMKLARVVRLVFVPLVNEWLRRYARFGQDPDARWEPVSLAAAIESRQVDAEVIKELNQILRAIIRRLPEGARWSTPIFAVPAEGGRDVEFKIELTTLEHCIDSVFGELFENLGELSTQFDCHLVIVSGKPSELPRIRERIVEAFPLSPGRIIQMRNFPAGDWYPFSTFREGRITDAKTCTVVGAALLQDMENGHLEGFVLRDESEYSLARSSFWNVIPANGRLADFHQNYLFSPADYPEAGARSEISVGKSVTLSIPCRIGRQIVRAPSIHPDPVYELVHEPQNGPVRSGFTAKVKLRWISALGAGERIEVESVVPSDPHVYPEDLRWRLNTLLTDEHWLDKPSFDLLDETEI